MNEKELLDQAAQHAGPLVAADQLLHSLAESIINEAAKRAQLSQRKAEEFYDTPQELGYAMIRYYIDKIASEKRMPQISHHNEKQLVKNFELLSGLTTEECEFLIQNQIHAWAELETE